MEIDDTEEFAETVGSEYKEPEPIVFVLFRITTQELAIRNKKELPADAVFMGVRDSSPHLEEWWSPEVVSAWGRLKERMKNVGMKNFMGIKD